MTLVNRLLAAFLVVLGLALSTACIPALAASPAPFEPEQQKTAKPAPKKVKPPHVLKAPTAKEAVAAKPKAPAAPTPAPRVSVETKSVPAFVPPGPPPLDETTLHAPVLAVLKAAQAMATEADDARWIDTGACWVWVGLKRGQAWSKYRFTYNGGCKQGRADGQGHLKIESQEAPGKWTPFAEYDATFLSGVPLGESGEKGGAKLIVGLPDGTVLSWMGASLNEETEVFTVGMADEQGRATPCAARSMLAIEAAEGIGGDRFKHLLRRSISVVNSQCPERVRTLWLASLAPVKNLTLSGRQGQILAEPLSAQAEIREGVIYDYDQRFATTPPLISQATAVSGAPTLTWTPPIEELDQRLLLVLALPVFLLLLLLVAMRIAYASTRHVMVQVTPPKQNPAKARPPANNAKRR